MGRKKTIKRYELKKNPSEFEAAKIDSSVALDAFVRKFYGDDLAVYESCFILLCNRYFFTEGYAKISQGGVAGTVVDPLLIGKYAVDSLASSVYLAHNHPSGNLNPSDDDNRITLRVKETLKILGSRLIDHIIITEHGYYSYADEGKI